MLRGGGADNEGAGLGPRLRLQVNAKAAKPEQSRRRPATVTARKLFEANSSRMVTTYRVPLLEENDCPFAQSKDSRPRGQFRLVLMF
jgi:hypothetical protein